MPLGPPPRKPFLRKYCRLSSRNVSSPSFSSSLPQREKGSLPMKTEEIQRTPRSHDPGEVSRALQELTPLSCTIVDRHGRPVRLSSAGYVLRFGKSYHVRIRPPFKNEEIREVRII